MEYKNLPDLNGWATLRSVVERGGVTEAARALHIGQPAVTKRMRALEECYGVALMERVAGRLRLTNAGEKVYVLAVQSLDRHWVLQQELERLANGQDSMRLEVTSSIGNYLLPGVLLQFNETYPSYKIDTRMGYSRDIQVDLATRIADLAMLEFAPDHPDILVQKWRDDELWLVCSTNHPLAGVELLPVEKLGTLDYVLREPQSSMRQTMDKALRGVGVDKLNVAIEVGLTDTIIEILASGRHVSFLPRFVVEERVAKGSLFHIKTNGFRVMRTLWIARHRGNLHHQVVEAFIDMLQESKPDTVDYLYQKVAT
jgi:DNA-binding transcriptional LysR family regulator